MERQERQRQADLEAQREAVRKQLENGIEIMYQEAMRVYNQGDYVAAAAKFKDVQDILPGYKRAEQYMDDARMKSLTVKTAKTLISADQMPSHPSSFIHQYPVRTMFLKH